MTQLKEYGPVPVFLNPEPGEIPSPYAGHVAIDHLIHEGAAQVRGEMPTNTYWVGTAVVTAVLHGITIARTPASVGGLHKEHRAEKLHELVELSQAEVEQGIPQLQMSANKVHS